MELVRLPTRKVEVVVPWHVSQLRLGHCKGSLLSGDWVDADGQSRQAWLLATRMTRKDAVLSDASGVVDSGQDLDDEDEDKRSLRTRKEW